MRLFAAFVCLLSLAGRLHAHPNEKVLEVGKAGLSIDGQVAADDVKVKVMLEDGKTLELPSKRYSVKLAGSKSYLLLMRSAALDSFLAVKNDAGKQIDCDDDSGGGQDAALTLDVKADRRFERAS